MFAQLTGTPAQEDALSDAAVLGVPLTEADLALDRSHGIGVWRINVPAVNAFLAVQSQFRDGVLDYAGSEAGLRLAALEMTPELWSQVRLIESGANAAWHESRP